MIRMMQEAKVLKNEKPDLLISSGAAVAFPFFCIAKIMGKKLIFIEVYDRIDKPTLTGKLVYPIVDAFIVQWQEQLKAYPKGIYFSEVFSDDFCYSWNSRATI